MFVPRLEGECQVVPEKRVGQGLTPVICVYDKSGNVIETQEHKGDFKEVIAEHVIALLSLNSESNEVLRRDYG